MNTNSLSKLYIPFHPSPLIGGPYTFMANLQKFMDKEGINYKTTHEGASDIFFPIQFDEEVIKSIKSTGGKVIQRLDGIYYPSKHGDKYIELNRELKKIYLQDLKSIAFILEKATSDFWDKHWETKDLENQIRSFVSDDIFIPMVRKYLPKGCTVLEGGCGRGNYVHALKYNGYNAIGVDFAEKTVEAINQSVPELDIRIEDVRNLSLHNETLDGYISAGVIEHFWEGYDMIVSEMKRTIKKNGYLFISFPYMSPLRKIKIFLRRYTISNSYMMKDKNKYFYQFALNHKEVLKKFNNYGFELIESKPFDGIKGLKDEVKVLKSTLQNVYDGKTHQKLKPLLDKLFKPFASHCILLVLKRL